MRAHFLLGSICGAAVAMWSCGGGGGGDYSNSSPSAPSPTPAAPAPAAPGSVAVSIVDTNGGAKAFTPNPVQAATGVTMVWTNNTRDMHHLVMDDGSAVIGDIAPGASISMQLKGSGGNYHCTNHPTMVGSINGATAPAPPPGDTPPPGDGY